MREDVFELQEPLASEGIGRIRRNSAPTLLESTNDEKLAKAAKVTQFKGKLETITPLNRIVTRNKAFKNLFDLSQLHSSTYVRTFLIDF